MKYPILLIALLSTLLACGCKSTLNEILDVPTGKEEKSSPDIDNAQTPDEVPATPTDEVGTITASGPTSNGTAEGVPATPRSPEQRALQPSSFLPQFNQLQLDENGLPVASKDEFKMPERVDGLGGLLMIQPRFKSVEVRDADQALAGLVLADHGYLMRLQHVMGELDGSVVYGQVQNEVAVAVQQRGGEVSAKERRAIESSVVAGLDPERRHEFREFVKAREESLVATVGVIAGDVVFFANAVKGLEGLKKRFEDAPKAHRRLPGRIGEIGDVLETSKRATMLLSAINQARELRNLSHDCKKHAELLRDRMHEWDAIAEEI